MGTYRVQSQVQQRPQASVQQHAQQRIQSDVEPHVQQHAQQRTHSDVEPHVQQHSQPHVQAYPQSHAQQRVQSGIHPYTQTRPSQASAYGESVAHDGAAAHGAAASAVSRGLDPRVILVIAVVAIVVVIVTIILARGGKQTQTAEASQVEAGVSYIQALEARDPTEVQTQISDNQRQQKIDKLLSGEVSIWSMFEDYVILGDSRAVGFYYYGFLDRSRVLAEGGSTIADVEGHYSEIQALDPKEIFLCYGLNDISIGYWDTVDEYIAALNDVITGLDQLCPNATVYVSSTLPAQDPAFERSEKWRNIPDWNVAIKAWCDSVGVPYIDNTAICEEHSDMWDSDGIHVYPDFYQYWAGNMITEVLNHEQS